MMIQIANSYFTNSRELPVSAASPRILEGQALVKSIENGNAVVRPSTGASTELFAGIALGQKFNPDSAIFVQIVHVPAVSPYVANLTWTPIASASNMLARVVSVDPNTQVVTPVSLAVYDATLANAAGYAVAVGGNNALTMSFNAALAGKTVEVTYQYSLTMMQLIALYGETYSPFTASEITGSIGVISDGMILTDQFEVSDNWAAFTSATPLVAGPNGLFTMASGAVGAPVSGSVEHVPTETSPFLGLRVLAH